MNRTPTDVLSFTLRSLILTVLLAVQLAGCYSSRWEKFDETMKSQIGVKNKDHYIVQWGPPSKRAKLDDGGEVLTWEWQGHVQNQHAGHSQGWQKNLSFSADGLLKDYKWEYWGMPLVDVSR